MKSYLDVILSHELKKGLDQYIQLLRELDVNELSISTLITNNDRNRKDKRYLNNTDEIMDFYTYIINQKLDDCCFLDKLDFIIPSCACQGGNCECGKSTLIEQMAFKGYKICPEASRIIIDEYHSCFEKTDTGWRIIIFFILPFTK